MVGVVMEPADGGEPIRVISSAMEILATRDPLPKNAAEDAQAFGFLLTLSAAGDSNGPFSIRPGSDPPDRLLQDADGREWAFELTTLTLESVREEWSRARQIGRELEAALAAQPDRYPHLVGTRVNLNFMSAEPIPRKREPFVAELAQALLEDRGLYSGEPVPGAEDRPFGMTGVFSERAYSLIVYPNGAPGRFMVEAGAQVNVRNSEIVGAFERIVRAKDIAANEVLLVSVAAPDPRGRVCMPDTWMFDALREHFDDGAQLQQFATSPPTHLQAVFVHLWGTGRWFPLAVAGPPLPLLRP